MRGKWVVYALVGWLPGVSLAPLDGAEALRRRDLPPVVRTGQESGGTKAPARREEATEPEGHGLTVQGRRFLVWDEDPRTAEQWAAELRPFDSRLDPSAP